MSMNLTTFDYLENARAITKRLRDKCFDPKWSDELDNLQRALNHLPIYPDALNHQNPQAKPPEIHIHLDDRFLNPLLVQLHQLNERTATIMTTQTELQAALAASNAQLQKAFGELRGAVDTLTQQVRDLTDAVQNAPVSPELQAAADAIKATSQELDDIVPDAP